MFEGVLGLTKVLRDFFDFLNSLQFWHCKGSTCCCLLVLMMLLLQVTSPAFAALERPVNLQEGVVFWIKKHPRRPHRLGTLGFRICRV